MQREDVSIVLDKFPGSHLYSQSSFMKIELEFELLFSVHGGKTENSEKTLQERTRTNNKLNPHMTPSPGFEPGCGVRRVL